MSRPIGDLFSPVRRLISCGCHGSLLSIAIAFANSAKELKVAMNKLEPRMAQNGMIWAAWPKKASGAATDLAEDGVRRIGLDIGLVDVKVCAIDATWSGLKFVRRLKDRR